MAMTSAQMSEMYRFFIVAFGAAPGTTYMSQLDEALNAGMSTIQVVNAFTQKPQFTDTYPGFLSPLQFANRLIENVVKQAASDEAKAQAVADVVAALESGMSRGDVIYHVFTNISAKPVNDPMWGRLVQQMDNQVAAADYFTSTLLNSTTDLSVLRSVVANITDTQAGMSQARLAFSGTSLTEAQTNDGSVDTVITISLSGDRFKGAVGTKLGSVQNVPAGLTADLIKVSDTLATLKLSGRASTHTDLSSVSDLAVQFSGSDFVTALTPQNANQTGMSVIFRDIWPTIEAGSLSLKELPRADLTIDLVKNQISQGSTSVSPLSGNLSTVTNVDLSAMPAPLIGNFAYATRVVGGPEANLIIGSNLGDEITPNGGLDSIVLGSGADKVYFFSESTPGHITIQNYNPAPGADQLDFSAFLQRAAVENPSFVDTNRDPGDARVQWSNGDVLVALTQSNLSSDQVANLLNTFYVTPNSALKAVLITGDVSGDATVWYVTNASGAGVNQISSSEVRMVGTLKEVSTVDVAGSFLTYASSAFEEAQANDGSISNSITITLVGDKFKGNNGVSLGTVTNVPVGLKATLTKINDGEARLTLTGKASVHAEINSIDNLTVTFASTNFLSGTLPMNATNGNLSVSFRDIWPEVSSFELTIKQLPLGTLNIDLIKDQITQGSELVTPVKGVISDVLNVDLSGVPVPRIGATVYDTVIVGDTSANVIKASPLGDDITPGGGADRVVLGNGQDTVRFFSGNDEGFVTIEGFNPADNGDSLDFAAFLTQAATGRLRFVDTNVSSSANKLSWSDGDQLIALSKTNLTELEVSNLLYQYYTAPTTASKAVLFTGDVVGDTTIWYITNQSGDGVDSISASEVRKVGVLKGVSTDDLSGAFLSYSSTKLIEAETNIGTVTSSILITLVGDQFRGNIGSSIGTVTNVPTGMVARLIKVSDVEAQLTLSGAVSSHDATASVSNLTVTFTGANFVSGGVPIDAVKTDLAVEFRDLWPTISNGLVTIKQVPVADLEVNLHNQTMTQDGLEVTPVEGSLETATGIDLSKMSALGVDDFEYLTRLVGTSSANVIKASPFGDSIVSNGGNDVITLGDGQDTVEFFKESVSGFLTIHDFEAGTNGDILDFGDFLLQTGTGNITFVDTNAAAPTTPKAWSNGDILMALTDAEDEVDQILALFGTYFANPTTAGKLVLMTADVTGDTSIWYIINKSGDGVDEITEDEIIRVGVLKDVNNYELAGFVSGNFI